MKTAFLYAGQGSQKTGMGKDFYEAYPSFRTAFDSALPVNGGTLSFDLHDICFNNPDNLLLQTEYTQPCMVAFACGVTAVLSENGLVPDYTCGLSLGEYSALNCAGVWTAKTTIETVAYRGKVMAEASEGLDVGMTAVIGLDEEKVEECCQKSKEDGVVSITNYNCPGQIVIGGEKAAVEKASTLCKEAGAKRCLPLAVSGPFHTELMKPAGEKLREYLERIEFSEMQIPVLFNYLGHENNVGDEMISLLVQQIQHPVRMEECIRRLFDEGVERFVEIGPGTALSGFVKKTAKAMGVADYKVVSIETVEDLEGLLKS